MRRKVSSKKRQIDGYPLETKRLTEWVVVVGSKPTPITKRIGQKLYKKSLHMYANRGYSDDLNIKTTYRNHSVASYGRLQINTNKKFRKDLKTKRLELKKKCTGSS